jgi:hypothetical protein
VPQPSDVLTGRTLVISCGALAGEIRAITNTAGWEHVDFEYLPANFHNRPEKITPALSDLLSARASDYGRILIGYGDCGTGGHLDRLLEHYPTAQRLPGDHCYAFFAGLDRFMEQFEGELGTFFLTDFLVRHQDTLIFGALGLSDHPELIDTYFGNYSRVLYIAQSPTPDLTEAARSCAKRLNLNFDQLDVGRGHLESRILEIRVPA